MAKYVTMNDVKNLKESLNESYKNVFDIHTEDELTKKERAIYDKYTIANAFALFEGEAFKKLNPLEQIVFLSIKKKLNGINANNKNTPEALGVLREAYKNHFNHTAPKWYQLTKRYIYWKEANAIKEFENKLEAKGIMRTAMAKARSEGFAMSNREKIMNMDMNTSYPTAKEKLTINLTSNLVEEKDLSFVNNNNKNIELISLK